MQIGFRHVVVFQWHSSLNSTLGIKAIYMRQIISIIVVLTFLYPATIRADCSDAVSNGDDAYTYARKAYRESSFDDAQNYARKAKNAADDAKSAAEDCNCDEATSEFDDAYTYARRAYNASDLSELRDYARRAMRAAEARKEAAENCR